MGEILVTRGATRLAMVYLLLVTAGCAFERRSPQYVCDSPDDCEPGHTCDQGWCVDTSGDGDGGGGPDADPDQSDAPPGTPDAFVCPAACTSCTIEGTCVMTCDPTSSCSTPVICPAGIPCKVECNGESSCMAGIDCAAAASCRIECTNLNSCAGPIACGAGVCRVECSGASSCGGGIDCDTACQCDTFCTGSGSCAIAPVCPPPGQCTSGTECTSAPGPCNTC